MFNLKYDFDWGIPFREPYLQWMIRGVEITLLVAVVTSVASLILGTALAVMRVTRIKPLRVLSRIYIEIFRNIPGLFWLLFFYFIFPELLPSGLGAKLNSYRNYSIAAGILGLTLNNTAYVAEILRSGLMGIPKGQREAAISTGMSRVQQYTYVLLPQSYRKILPPMGTQMIHNFKNTSLCMAISVPELTWATQQIESLTFRGLEVTTLATCFYIMVSLSLGAVIILLEKYYKIDISSITHIEEN
ncbi:MAG: amino acid ABC transporter permease [Nitrospirae bacterium]|nr:amino acid ABC transporter permease [Nitrospirota bacterium]